MDIPLFKMNNFSESTQNVNQKWKIWFWLLALVDLILVQLSDSTFDSGDSVLHYLQASIAFTHPEFFLDHWSKPLFVLLSSPFACFGFKGMALFNSLCVMGATYLTFLTLSKYSKHAWLIIPIAVSSPEWMLCQSSGLTEPLFALLLSLSIWMYDSNRKLLAALFIGFLPFVRSEGWLIMPVWAVLMVLNKNFKHIWALSLGHLVYGIVGFAILNDFLWMFHRNPYQGVEAKYGHGHWTHYLEQTPYLMGIPNSILFFIGMLYLTYLLFKKKSWLPFNLKFLIPGVCVAFYFSHSIFWHMGWFHSFGLKRVFIAIFPCMVAAAAIPLINLQLSKLRILNYFLLPFILIFPYTGNKSGFRLPASVQRNEEQRNIDSAIVKMKAMELDKQPVAFGNYYVAMALKLDIRNPKEVCPIEYAQHGPLPSGTLVFWDSYFAVSDKSISDSLFKNSELYDFIGRFGNKESLNRVELYLAK